MSHTESDGGQEIAPTPPVNLQEHESLNAELNRLKTRLQEGYAVDFNDFSYQPRSRSLEESSGGLRLRNIFEAGDNIDRFTTKLKEICQFNQFFRQIPALQDDIKSATDPYWENWWLPGLDACILYGLISTIKPRIYCEVGSGNSTKFVRRAILDQKLDTKIISIDPHPMAAIDQICDSVVRKKLEDVPPDIFDQLDERDMLFVDNSHRSFQNSDVTVFFTELLPTLKKGLVYGVHDIFLPWDYPPNWTDRWYNEQYLLMTYLLGGADGDDVLFPSHFIYKDPRFRDLFNSLFVCTRHIDWLTSSFWMRKSSKTPT